MGFKNRFKIIEEGLFANQVAQVLNGRMSFPRDFKQRILSEAISYFDSIIAYNNLVRFSILSYNGLEGMVHEKDFLSIEREFKLFTTEQYVGRINDYIDNLKKMKDENRANSEIIGKIADYFTKLSSFKYLMLVEHRQREHYSNLH